MFVVAKVKYLTIGTVAGGSTQERFHHIGNEIEIAPLLSTAENLDRFLFDQPANPNSKKRLARIFHSHPGSISVGQPQGAGANLIDVVVKQVVPLARELVNSVHVDRIDRVFLIDWQILRPAVDLSRAGENDFQVAVVQPAGFQNVELGRSVDI